MSRYVFAGWQLEAGVDCAKILSITTWDCVYVVLYKLVIGYNATVVNTNSGICQWFVYRFGNELFQRGGYSSFNTSAIDQAETQAFKALTSN